MALVGGHVLTRTVRNMCGTNFTNFSLTFAKGGESRVKRVLEGGENYHLQPENRKRWSLVTLSCEYKMQENVVIIAWQLTEGEGKNKMYVCMGRKSWSCFETKFSIKYLKFIQGCCLGVSWYIYSMTRGWKIMMNLVFRKFCAFDEYENMHLIFFWKCEPSCFKCSCVDSPCNHHVGEY